LDVRGLVPSVGMLTNNLLFGMNMWKML